MAGALSAAMILVALASAFHLIAFSWWLVLAPIYVPIVTAAGWTAWIVIVDEDEEQWR